jgi:hypothetical protein
LEQVGRYCDRVCYSHAVSRENGWREYSQHASLNISI